MQKKKILNNKGQGVMEYVILSSLIGIFCLTMVAQYGDVLKKRIDYMKQSLSQNLERDIYNLDN